jgi:hypothetical protein
VNDVGELEHCAALTAHAGMIKAHRANQLPSARVVRP